MPCVNPEEQRIPASSNSFIGGNWPPPRSAYCHIPFCRRRCFYCDFPVSVVGDRPPLRSQAKQAQLNGNNWETIAHYVTVLCQEIEQTPNLGSPLDTIFLGGGTPSLLSVEQVGIVLQRLDQRFGIAAGAEISMEIDPGTFDRSQLQGYQRAGVNRVSLGVQAFQPELLAACGRAHTVEDVYAAVAMIHQAGLENFSLDLISGLPHQTLEHWQASLDKAIALAPAHLSCYDLTVEPVTAFSRRYQPGLAPLPSDQTTAGMYRLASQRLRQVGYEHYEISNYAKPGYACRHNCVYWENRPFYGFGMGATSYVNGDRVARPRKTGEYAAWVQTSQGALAVDGPTSPTEYLLDTLMVGLRLADGLSLPALVQQFGEAAIQTVWHCLAPFWQTGWVAVIDDQGEAIACSNQLPWQGVLRLTDPEGFLFSNVILVSLFAAFESDS